MKKFIIDLATGESKYVEMEQDEVADFTFRLNAWADGALARAKSDGLGRITAARNQALSQARGITADFNGEIWDADEATWLRIGNLVTLYLEAQKRGLPVPDKIPWRTYDNKDVLLTLDEMVYLGAAVSQAYEAVWTKQAALKNQIAQAALPEDIEKVGW